MTACMGFNPMERQDLAAFVLSTSVKECSIVDEPASDTIDGQKEVALLLPTQCSSPLPIALAAELSKRF